MVHSLFRVLGRLVVRYPIGVITFYVLLAGLSAYLTANYLEHKTGQNDLVGTDLEYNRRFLAFQEEFGDLEFIYVVIRVGEDPARAMAASDALADKLRTLAERGERDAPLIRSVLHRTEPEAFRFGLPFRSVDDLARIEAWMSSNGSRVQALASVRDFAGLFEAYAQLLDPVSLSESGMSADSDHSMAESLFGVLEGALASSSAVLDGGTGEGFLVGLQDRLELSPLERGYIGSKNGAFLLLEIAPRKDMGTVEIIREPLLAIRSAIDEVRSDFPGLELGLTGRPVLQADEMITTQKDTSFATVIALCGVLVLFVLFFRRLRRPIFAVVTLGLSILITFGVVTMTLGYLTLLTIVFAAMLVGLGIDFGIHFVSRYQDELLKDGRIRRSICDTLETTGVSIGIGAVTTAAAFFTILFVDFQGLRELGFIAGVGVLLCFLAMVTLLPALVFLADGWSAKRRRLIPPKPVRVPFIDRFARHAKLTICAAVLVSLAGILTFDGLPYNANIIELQAQELESVEYEKALLEESDFSTWYCAYVVDSIQSLEGVLGKLDALKPNGVLGGTESVLDWLPSEQESKKKIFGRMHAVVSDIELVAPVAAVDTESVADSLDSLLDSVDDLASAAIQRQEIEAAKKLEELARQVEALGDKLSDAPLARVSALGAYQVEWFRELQGLLGGLRDAVVPADIGPLDLPAILRRKFVSTDGERYLAYAYPNKDIWEEENMSEFIREVRSVDPDVTGTPVQVFESSTRMRDGFVLAAIYSLIVTLIFLLIDLRSLTDAVLAMVPLLVGLLWLLEALPVLGLHFNLANFFTLPILIGCGIDGGVHIIHRFRETRSTSDVLQGTCSAVTLSFLTTMVGFGAMSFAMHRGVRSLGQMMVTGLSCVLIASVFVLPAILALIENHRNRSSAK